MTGLSTIHTMTLDGGIACLDFVNAGYDIQKNVMTERVHSYDDLLILAGRLYLLDKGLLARLKAQALSNNEDAGKALAAARDARRVMYDIFSAIALDQLGEVDPHQLFLLNQLFAEALPFRKLAVVNDLPGFVYQFTKGDLMPPVWCAVLSAYDLLQQDNLGYIKQCHRCSWLFPDTTKNHRRKWCSMNSCGSALKGSRYYRRKKVM